TSARRALTDFTTKRLNSSLTSVVIATRRHPLVRLSESLRWPSRWLLTSPHGPPAPRPGRPPACPGHVKVYQVWPRRRSGPQPVAASRCVAVARVRGHWGLARH